MRAYVALYLRVNVCVCVCVYIYLVQVTSKSGHDYNALGRQCDYS